MTHTKVRIAGAGALGLASALALADAGCAVEVWDPAAPADNASGVAAGMLAPVFEAVLDAAAGPHFDVLMAGREAWMDFAARAAVPLDRRGALAKGRAEWLQGLADAMSALGVEPETVTEAAAEILAPGAAAGPGLLARDDWRIDAAAALSNLRRACGEAGVSFRGERVRDRGDADWLLVATGADRDLAAFAPETQRLAPIKGHILRLAGPAYTGVVLRGEGAYAVPAPGGLMLGATMEPGRSDRAVDPARVAGLTEAGGKLFPSFNGAVTALTGVRAETSDGLPLAGFSRTPGVLVAAGARRNGWLLAPLIAQLVAACVTGREPGPYAARLDPRRFD